MKNKYKLIISNKQIKIFINDILHLSIKQKQLVGIQSWIMGYDADRKYCIEYTLKTSVVLSEYDDAEKWKSILDLLNKNDIFH